MTRGLLNAGFESGHERLLAIARLFWGGVHVHDGRISAPRCNHITALTVYMYPVLDVAGSCPDPQL